MMMQDIKRVRIMVDQLRKLGVPKTRLAPVSEWANTEERKLNKQTVKP